MRARIDPHVFFLLLLVSLVLFFLDRIELLDPIKRPVQSVSLPLQQGMADITSRVQGLGGGITSLWFAQKRYEALQKQYALALASEARLRILEDENRKLTAQLGAAVTKGRKLVPAHIIARNPEVLVDRGKADNLSSGMVVLTGDILVGRLDKIGPRTSRVVLPSDSYSKIMVMTQKSQQKGILTGNFGAGMKLTKVLQEQPLQENQLVLTSGEDTIFPQGLTVGKISRVFRKESDLFQEAGVIPLIETADIDTVFILLE